MKADTPFLRQQQEECYEHTNGLLKRWVSDFLTYYKIPREQFERYMSAAHEGWVDGYRDVDLSKGAFSTILYFKVLKYLNEERKLDRKQTRLLVPAKEGVEVADTRKSYLKEIRAEVSPEARLLMDLVLDPPLDMKLAMVRDGEIPKRPAPARMRKLMEQVCKEAGWTAAQIAKAWQEVTEALFS